MKKHFLLLLMAFFSLAGYAEELDVTKFTSNNIAYGTMTLAGILTEDEDYALEADYEIDLTHFYTSNTGAGETAVVTGTGEDEVNNLQTARPGLYYIKITGTGEYMGSVIYKDFRIYPFIVTINFDEELGKTFGDTDPEVITYTLTLNGDLVEDDEAIEALVEASGLTVSRSDPTNNNAGEYDLLYSVTDANYQVSRAEGDEDVYTISPKAAEELSITLTLPTTAPTYTGAPQAPTFTVKDGETTLPVKDFTLAYLPCDEEGNAEDEFYLETAVNAGYYLVKAVPAEGGNYEGESGNAEEIFQIAPALLNVYVTPQSRDYTGEEIEVGEVAVAYSGLVGADASQAAPFGDNFEVNYADADDEEAEHINAGTYELEITADEASMEEAEAAAFANYEFTPLAGTLTVKPLKITVKPADSRKDFGAADPDPVSEVVVTGAVNEEDEEAIATAYTVSREEGEEIKEDYVISLTKKADADLTDVQKITLKNYDFTPGTAKFSVVAGTLYVYAESKSKIYGADDPEFTVMATTASGTPVELTTTPAVKAKVGEEILDEMPTAAGTYVLVVEDGAAAEGYTNIVKLNGQYTIIPKPLTPVIATQTLQEGDELDQTKVTFTGLVEGDEIAYELDFAEEVYAGEYIDAEGDVPVIREGAGNATFATGIEISQPEEFDEEIYANANYMIEWDAVGKLVIGEGTPSEEEFEVIAGIDEINALNGETQDVEIQLGVRTRNVPATKAHSWKAETWNTMVLPFDVTVAELSEQLGYAIVNRVDAEKTTEGNVVFKLEMQSIPANEPFCVKTADDIDDETSLYFHNKLIVAGDPSVDAGQGYKFVGAYEELTIDKTKSLFYFLRGDNAKWAHIGASSENTWKVVPFDAYVDQSGSASARELTFTFQELDGSYTAIRSIEANTNDIESAKTGIYTIGGMKLQGAPAQKGVYIKDGKKMILK
jgi:hypothetical protein